MYDLGYRHFGLTWNEENEFATGVGSPNMERGLTELGHQAVALAEEPGMILDVSHLNDASFWGLVESSKKPFIASQSNARSLSDQQIRVIARRGGVIGIIAWGDFVRVDRKPILDDLVKHVDHLVNLGGIESVGCGFDFCDYFDSDPTAAEAGGEVTTVFDFENCTQTPNLGKTRQKHGYSPDQILLLEQTALILRSSSPSERHARI